MSNLISIRKIESFKNKRALLRLDLNLPIKDGRIIDDFRLRKILPTLHFLKKHQAKIIIISHLGRGGKESLSLVSEHLRQFFKVRLIKDYKKNW